ncbi:MAG: hypothetical protein ACXV8P_07220, partial [Methylobacter sp.]
AGKACTPERLMHSAEQIYCIQCGSKACRKKPMLILSSWFPISRLGTQKAKLQLRETGSWSLEPGN